MKILFIHPNMPGQFKHLCRHFAKDPANQVVFLTKPRPQINLKNVHKLEYVVPREPSAHTHRYVLGFERAVLQGQEAYRMCRQLKKDEGFVPDVIVAHPGWGDTLFIKDVYPDTPILSFFEFYYSAYDADVNFDPNEPCSEDDIGRIRVKNSTNIFALEQSDWGISPTFWQYSRHPETYRPKISVIHDGVDTDYCKPGDPDMEIDFRGVKLTPKDEVITYVARNFEPYRGFPTFMRAAAEILKRRPNAHIVAVGADGVSYGKAAPSHTTYRKMMMQEVNFCDPSRIHFFNTQPYNKLMALIQLSSAHIYLTYPFVLSWSMVEAMSCGALVIGSRTAPVEEVIDDGRNGLLVDFFEPKEIADKVDEIFAHKDRMQHLRDAARQTVLDRYALKTLLPLHASLVTDLADRKTPPPTAERIRSLYAQTQSAKAEELAA